MIVPARIRIGPGVRIEKSSHAGVRACRLRALAKKAKTSSSDRGSQISELKVLGLTIPHSAFATAV
jgi:hypothetical protein